MSTALNGSSHLSEAHTSLNESEIRWMVELHDLQSRADSLLHELIWRFLQVSTNRRTQIGEVIDQAREGFEKERVSLQSEIAIATKQLAELQRESDARRVEPAHASMAPTEQASVSSPELKQTESSLAQLRAFEAEARSVMDPSSAVARAPFALDILILGVMGYKDAAAIVRGLRQVPSVSETDITQFTPGRLHLNLTVNSAASLSKEIVAASPLALSILGEDAAGLTFRVLKAL
jgi:hypothetical protein